MHRHLLNVVEQILLKEERLQLEQDTLHTVSTAPAFVSWGAVPQRYFPQNLSSTCRSLHKSKRLMLLLQFFHQNVHSILNVSNHMNSMDHPHWLTMHNICRGNLTGLYTNLHVIKILFPERFTNQRCSCCCFNSCIDLCVQVCKDMNNVDPHRLKNHHDALYL